MPRFFFIVFFILLFSQHISVAQRQQWISFEYQSLTDRIRYLEEKIEKAEKNNRSQKIKKIKSKLCSLYGNIVENYDYSYDYAWALYSLVDYGQISKSKADSMLYKRDLKMVNRLKSYDYGAFNRLAEIEFVNKNYQKALAYNSGRDSTEYESFCGRANFTSRRSNALFAAKCYEAMGQIDSALAILHYNNFARRPIFMSNDEATFYWASLIKKKYSQQYIQQEIENALLSFDPKLDYFNNHVCLFGIDYEVLYDDKEWGNNYFGYLEGTISKADYLHFISTRFRDAVAFKSLLAQ